MEVAQLLQALLSEQTPALPDLTVLRSARYLSWALVLAALSMVASRRLSRPWRCGLAALLMLWTLIPGPVSPAFWLSLAFQMPSLMSTAIAAWLFVRLGQDKPDRLASLMQNKFGKTGLLVAVVLGWLLLLDTFAVLPVSMYSTGFSPIVLGLWALLALMPWLFWGSQAAACQLSLLLILVLTVHVVLRVPTGNVWDALIDPWLWLILQWLALREGLGQLSAKWRAPKATRA